MVPGAGDESRFEDELLLGLMVLRALDSFQSQLSRRRSPEAAMVLVQAMVVRWFEFMQDVVDKKQKGASDGEQ